MSRQWPRLRRRPVPARRPLRSTEEAHENPVPRIDALTSAGRANWLALLGYLAFVMVTTLGVEDIDFFVDSRQTQLPLVNVSIPTVSFFVFAPILGAALYVHLHLHVRKVAEALAEAPAGRSRLEERIAPWMLNDFILRERRDRERVIRARPLDRLAGVTSGFLVWWAGPVVLMLMWARTWPAHELWLSLLCAACLLVSIYAGLMSWTKSRQDLGHWGRRSSILAGIIFLFLVPPMVLLTFANSEGIEELVEVDQDLLDIWGVDPSVRLAVEMQKVANRADTTTWQLAVERKDRFLSELMELDPPMLTAARLSVLPPEVADPDTARQRYRADYCKKSGIDLEICGRPIRLGGEPTPYLLEKRDEWCAKHGQGVESSDCGDFFSALDRDFEEEWAAYRGAVIASIDKPDLRGKDLRRADLSRAELAGMDLSRSRLEGANLNEARMERTELGQARMAGATLIAAQLRDARLGGVKMRRANLEGAQLEGSYMNSGNLVGANFRASVMIGVDMTWATADGADFSFADMYAANLSRSNFVRSKFGNANMHDVVMFEADLSGANFQHAVLQRASLDQARMEGTDFGFADLEGASLTSAGLHGAILTGANLRHTDWRNARVSSTLVNETDLRGVANLTQTILLGMIGDEETLLPDEVQGWDEMPYVQSCLPEGSSDWTALVATKSRNEPWDIDVTITVAELRAAFQCAPGEAPRKAGTPWPPDRDPPWVEDPNWTPADRGEVTIMLPSQERPAIFAPAAE